MKNTVLAIATIVFAASAASPAWALFCTNEGPTAPKIYVEEDGRTVPKTDEVAQNRMDTQRLREAGVPARSVERWNGCLRAFVETPDGRQAMEFYDPSTLRRLQ